MLVFNKPIPKLSVAAREVINALGDWYIDKGHTFIRICGASKSPHLLT